MPQTLPRNFFTTPHIWRYDPQQQQSMFFPRSNDTYVYNDTDVLSKFSGRGIVVSASGQIWSIFQEISTSQEWFVAFDGNTGEILNRVKLNDLAPKLGLFENGYLLVDGFGRLWCSLSSSNPGGYVDRNLLVSYQPTTGEFSSVTVNTVGDYSLTLGNFISSNIPSSVPSPNSVSPPSYYSLRIPGCQSATQQVLIWLQFQLQVQTPGASRIHVSYRSTNDTTILSVLPYQSLLDICTPGAVPNISCQKPEDINLLPFLPQGNLSFIDLRFDFYTDEASNNPSLLQVNTLSQCGNLSGDL